MGELINAAHFHELARLAPEDVCKRALCDYDPEQQRYALRVFDDFYHIFPTQERIRVNDESALTNEMLGLFAIHYLLTCVPTEPSGSWISEKDMIGGVNFFRGPHEIPTKLITERLDNSLSDFGDLCIRRSGTPLDMADAAYSFSVTDRIPLALLFWLGDEDFPAEVKLLYDVTLPNHFALDIVFALAVGACEHFSRSQRS